MTTTLSCHSFVFIISFVIKITELLRQFAFSRKQIREFLLMKTNRIFYNTLQKSIMSLHIHDLIFYSSKILVDFF